MRLVPIPIRPPLRPLSLTAPRTRRLLPPAIQHGPRCAHRDPRRRHRCALLGPPRERPGGDAGRRGRDHQFVGGELSFFSSVLQGWVGSTLAFVVGGACEVLADNGGHGLVIVRWETMPGRATEFVFSPCAGGLLAVHLREQVPVMLSGQRAFPLVICEGPDVPSLPAPYFSLSPRRLQTKLICAPTPSQSTSSQSPSSPARPTYRSTSRSASRTRSAPQRATPARCIRSRCSC